MYGNRYILTVVGRDHPGIVAGIADTLYRYGCNIQQLNQTVLSDEFAMILLLQPTREISVKELEESLKERCRLLEVTHVLREATTIASPTPYSKKDKVIITVIGSDKPGIIAGVAGVLADMNINIVEISAEPCVIRDMPQYSVVARVEVEEDMDMLALKNALEDCAKKVSVEIDIQNQEIFNAMHKI